MKIRNYLFLLVIVFARCGVAAETPQHPLHGSIRDTRDGRALSVAELEQRLTTMRFVLLGEVHDNAEHHRLRRDLIAALLRAGRQPALAMEQLDSEHQAAIDRALIERPNDSAYLRREARYNEKGWPWTWYGPMVELALAHGLPLVAANLSRARASAIVSKGLPVLGAAEVERLGLSAPAPAALRAKQAQLIDEGHCGKMPPEYLPGMVDAQRARDAQMAAALLQHAERGAVLIAGNGHVRRDIGVPVYLAAQGIDGNVISIGFVEVDDKRTTPKDYSEVSEREFDLVWFTSRTQRGDPCAGMRFSTDRK